VKVKNGEGERQPKFSPSPNP